MLALCLSLALAEHKPLHVTPVPYTQVTVQDSFWTPRQEANRRVSIPHQLDMLDQTGRIKNFELAGAGARTGYTGYVFNDSDTYKVIEAASMSLATHPDPVLEKRVDAMIAKIAKAQMPDGYIDTYYQINEPDRRLTNLRDNHELYCMGHLFEAAVAHHQATGKKTLLNVATKAADMLDRTFGPGKRMGYCGHPESELALVKLANDTHEPRYFKLAEFFVNSRGSGFFADEHNTPKDRYDGTYWLDQLPIRQQTTMVGHAVRAAYLMSGACDVMAQDHDEALMAMEDKVWASTTSKRMFVTGGIGPSGSNEGFTTDYDLPNLTAYQETCASIAMTMWNQRMAMLYGESRYADLVELALYNAVLAGGSLDGSKYFYVNPLASTGRHHRQPWYACACCPPNIARTIASIGGYAYGTTPGAVWVNLFMAGAVHTPVTDLKVATNYPWEGKATYTVQKPGTFELRFRRPDWVVKVDASLNGKPTPCTLDRGYVVVKRTWKKGDALTYWMTMPVRRVAADPRVKDDRGKLAIARGPLIYCLEGVDNAGKVLDVSIPADATFKVQPGAGYSSLTTTGYRGQREWTSGLYGSIPSPQKVTVTAVPYYAWDNRAAGEMAVWIPTNPEPPRAGGPEVSAKVRMSYRASNADPGGINDGSDPVSSGEQPAQLCHFWPHKGGDEWVEYSWTKPQTFSGSRVYFFDDTGRGECRLPAAWRLEAKVGNAWQAIPAKYEVHLDRWCEVTFAPLTASAIRIVVQQKEGWASGVRGWQVTKAD